MKPILSITLWLLLVNYINSQASLCTNENNIDYSVSVIDTYVYTTSVQLCCTLCGFKKGCVGINNRRKYKNWNGFKFLNKFQGYTFVISTNTCFLKSEINFASRTYSLGSILFN